MDRREKKVKRIAKGENEETPSIVLMELDGVLIDSESILYEAYNKLLEKSGLRGSKTEFQEIFGLPINLFLMELIEKYSVKKPIEQLEQEYVKLLSEQYHNISILPQAESFLKDATKKGYTLGLVATAPPAI